MYKIEWYKGQLVRTDLDNSTQTIIQPLGLWEGEKPPEDVDQVEQRRRLVEVFEAIMRIIDNAELLIGKPGANIYRELICGIQEASWCEDKKEEKQLRERLRQEIDKGCRKVKKGKP